ncbi:MAG: amidohydrolase [Armatimonadetes bacterium]|nr:amidohydrolase [Armatimonadota bacterium]
MTKVDVHGHLGWWWFPIPGGDLSTLLCLCDRYDIRHLLCSSAEAIVYDMRRGNEALARAIAGQDRILGYVVCHPRFLEASCQEMDTYLPEKEFVGVKIHPYYAATPLNHSAMTELVDEVAKRTNLVQIHTYSAADAAAMADLAARHPHVNFIMAHACAADSWAAADAATRHRNLYLDFCCSDASIGRVEYALATCGAEQIVFGSDMDLLDPAFTLGMFLDSGADDAQLQLMLYDNAARLLGLL